AERAKPYATRILVVVAHVIDGKPGIVLRSGCAAATLQYRLSRLNPLFLHVPLRGPAAAQIAQTIVGAARQVPGGGGHLLDGEGCVRTVLDLSRTPHDTGLPIGLVLQRDVDLTRDVLHQNAELIAIN